MSNKHNRKAIALVAGILSLVLVTAGATGIILLQKFLQHELKQNDRLTALEAYIDMLDAKGNLSDIAGASDRATEAIWLGGGLPLFSDRQQHHYACCCRRLVG